MTAGGRQVLAACPIVFCHLQVAARRSATEPPHREITSPQAMAPCAACAAREQPASYLKILSLLVPREHKVEHSNPLKDLTDEQLEAMIEYIETSLAAHCPSCRAGGNAAAVLA